VIVNASPQRLQLKSPVNARGNDKQQQRALYDWPDLVFMSITDK
jgi:hypothetical protein